MSEEPRTPAAWLRENAYLAAEVERLRGEHQQLRAALAKLMKVIPVPFPGGDSRQHAEQYGEALTEAAHVLALGEN